MSDNDTDISSADLREVARELSQSRGQEVVTVPDQPSGGDGDESLSLDEASDSLSHDRLRRLARERHELAAYERAAGLTEQDLPDSMDMSDAELAR
jgi:CRP-like cAMP-binding protein